MPRIFRFSPNWSDPVALEAITVAREDMIAGAVDAVRDSALTKNKHHLLFVGPRGSGKTHLITLVHYRLSAMGDLNAKLRIAWLNEDETSDTLLSLLLRTHRALSKTYPEEFPPESTEAVFDLVDRVEATGAISDLLLEQLGDRTLLILIENLDALFKDFESGEQKRWRALVQNHPQFCTVATAQRLFQEVAIQDAPFFGFFDVQHLQPFAVGDAVVLLEKIAVNRPDPDLAIFVRSSRGRARIQALHHLTGGNQRLFVILSEFVNRDSLDSLVTPFEELVDEQLTPYYQERLRWLPTQQRRIVEYLCTNAKPQSVKAIARHLFATSQTISGQLKELRRIGYVTSKKRGRESMYELAEPLMRLSHQVKEAIGRSPLRLLVDFLRVWYDREELERRLQTVAADEKMTRVYFDEAADLTRREGNLRLQYLSEDVDRINLSSCSDDELAALEALKDESNDARDLVSYALALAWRGDLGNAAAEFTAAIEMEGAPADQVVTSLFNRGVVYQKQGDAAEAIADYTAVIEMESAPAKQIADALYNRGIAHGDQADVAAEIADYSAVIEMEGVDAERVANALFNRGFVRGNQGDIVAEIADYSAVIEMEDVPADVVAGSLFNRGFAHGHQGDAAAATTDYTVIIEMEGAPADQVAGSLLNRGITHRQRGYEAEAIGDYTAVIEMEGAHADHVAKARLNRGITHRQQEDAAGATADYTAVIEMEGAHANRVAIAHFYLSEILMEQGAWQDAFEQLQLGFERANSSDEPPPADSSAMVRIIFQSGQSIESWRSKTEQLVGIFAENHALAQLGPGVVQSVAGLAESPLSLEGLSGWHSLWTELAEEHPELGLSARLLGTAIDYFTADRDETVLLDLPSEEREILRQALGLDEAVSSDESE